MFDTLMDKMQPGALENKKFDTQGKSKIFALSDFFSFYSFRWDNCFLKQYHWMMVYNCKIVDEDLNLRKSAGCF